jgi:hypothetical protein
MSPIEGCNAVGPMRVYAAGILITHQVRLAAPRRLQRAEGTKRIEIQHLQ